MFDRLKYYQENQIRKTDVPPQSYEKQRKEIETDPEFQQLVETNQLLDDALSVLQEADQVLSSPNVPSAFSTESNAELKASPEPKSSTQKSDKSHPSD